MIINIVNIIIIRNLRPILKKINFKVPEKVFKCILKDNIINNKDKILYKRYKEILILIH